MSFFSPQKEIEEIGLWGVLSKRFLWKTPKGKTLVIKLQTGGFTAEQEVRSHMLYY